MGPEILDVLQTDGADIEKVVLCHMQRNPDVYYYQSILDRGATICFDEPNKAAYRPDTEIAKNIKWLLDHGYENQLVLGMDGGQKAALASYMEPTGLANGCEYLLTRFVPLLRCFDITAKQIDKMLISNVANVFSIDA
jgi:phosphotriesterase-related protein